MRNEYVYLESSSQEMEEKAVFRFIVKSAAFILVGILGWVIISSIPPVLSFPMKAVIWFVVAFTITMLSIALACKSYVVRMHATILFGLGAVTVVIGLLFGVFPVS